MIVKKIIVICLVVSLLGLFKRLNAQGNAGGNGNISAIESAGINPAGKESITIERAVKLVLDNNLSLKRGAIDLQSRQRSADRAWNSLLPSISADMRANHGTAIVGDMRPEQDAWSSGVNFTTSVTFTLSTFDNIKRATVDYELGKLGYEAVKQELELQVRKLFYQILLLDANRQLAQISFESAESRYIQSADLVRHGQAPRLDELSARVDMENLRPTLKSSEVLYDNALDTFKTILGITPETEIALEGSLETVSPQLLSQRVDLIEAELDPAIETQSLKKSIESMQYQQNAIRRSAFFPYLRVGWSTTPLYNSYLEDWNDNGSFGVYLGMNFENFFKWSNARTQIENLDDSIRSAQSQLTEAEQNRNNRIAQFTRIENRIQESLEAMRLNVELAQTTYDLHEEAYKQGGIDYQQLKSASVSLEQSRNRLLTEQYNLISTLLDLEKELNVPFGTLYIGE